MTTAAARLHDTATTAEAGAADGLLSNVRIVVRPVASPSTIGLFGLAAGSFVLAGQQLGWVPQDETRHVAVALIAFAATAQFLATTVAIVARDVVVATAMAVLSLTWLVTGLVLWNSRPGTVSDALGLLLIVSGTTMFLVALTAATTKLAPGLVFAAASIRFWLGAAHQLSGDDVWRTTAGVVGVLLAAFAVYVGWALLVEGAAKQPVLPVGRRGAGAVAVHGSLFEQIKDTPVEPGVRAQL